MHDLMPPGAQPGTIPTDIEQATGLERLEILGKMQGVDIFDMAPLDASRRGMAEVQTQELYTNTHTQRRHTRQPNRSQELRRGAIRRLHRLSR